MQVDQVPSPPMWQVAVDWLIVIWSPSEARHGIKSTMLHVWQDRGSDHHDVWRNEYHPPSTRRKPGDIILVGMTLGVAQS